MPSPVPLSIRARFRSCPARVSPAEQKLFPPRLLPVWPSPYPRPVSGSDLGRYVELDPESGLIGISSSSSIRFLLVMSRFVASQELSPDLSFEKYLATTNRLRSVKADSTMATPLLGRAKEKPLVKQPPAQFAKQKPAMVHLCVAVIKSRWQTRQRRRVCR